VNRYLRLLIILAVVVALSLLAYKGGYFIGSH
jgi:hypothetical protein